RLDEAAVPQAHAVNRLPAVMCHGQDTCNTIRVVDLATDLLVLDELPDRNHSRGRRNKRVIRLARRALRLLLEADVEPDRRVERGELVDEDELELGLEGLGLVLGGEV